MQRLYAATGDGIARLDESADAWTVELFLPASGAQCLAVDPADPNTVYAGLREGGVRRTSPRIPISERVVSSTRPANWRGARMAARAARTAS